jgi:hypothetical protein
VCIARKTCSPSSYGRARRVNADDFMATSCTNMAILKPGVCYESRMLFHVSFMTVRMMPYRFATAFQAFGEKSTF